MALRSQLLWPAKDLKNNCYAQQPRLILFHWSCVFFFVRSAIAGCRCLSSPLKERSATLYLTGEPRLRPPRPPSLLRHFLSDGTVYFKAVLFLTYGLLTRGQSARFQIRFKKNPKIRDSVFKAATFFFFIVLKHNSSEK